MLLGYRNKETETFAQGENVSQFSGFERQGWRRLEVLDAVTCLNDLRALPNNRLEALRGDRDGQCSIRINGQWRICFIWPVGETGPSDVEIVDYH
jgi:proteic killer suppression protein